MSVENQLSDIIKESTKLKVSMIGIGNAGCQAADLAYKAGHSVMAINSSAKDLDYHLLNKEIPTAVIGNKRGAGKDRNIAKEFMKAELVSILDNPDFNSVVSAADVVVVVASTAGGTGSGAGPLLTNRIMAKYPNKIVIFFGILPKHSESAQAQYNTLECMNEVTNEKLGMTYILADLHYFEDDPNEDAFRRTGEYIVDCMNVIRGDYLNRSPYGMIDENDMLSILSTPGLLAIYHKDKITQKETENTTLQSIMVKAISSSPAAPMQRDKVVHNMGIFINATDQLDDPHCKAGDFSELEKFIGNPLVTFLNYAVVSKPTAELGVILSGMNKPIDRLDECAEIAKKCNAIFQERDVGDMSKTMAEMGAIRAARDSSHRSQILGIATIANDSEDVASDIPDIF